jgi:ketosteroid isomerase-like protein
VSRENVEIVRGLAETFERGIREGDPAKSFESAPIAADVEWVPAPGVPGVERYRGAEGLAEFLRVWTEDFDDWSVTFDEVIDAGDDRVVLLVSQSGTGSGSGVPVELRFAQIYELEAGIVTRIRFYLDRSEALEAAGLSD